MKGLTSQVYMFKLQDIGYVCNQAAKGKFKVFCYLTQFFLRILIESLDAMDNQKQAFHQYFIYYCKTHIRTLVYI